jgi:hypothetical protein
MEIFEMVCAGGKLLADLASGSRDIYGITADMERDKRLREAHLSGMAREAKQKEADEEYKATQEAAGDLTRKVRDRFDKLTEELDELKEARKKARTEEEKTAIAEEIDLLIAELAAMGGQILKKTAGQ